MSSRSQSPGLKEFAFRPSTALDLFEYYLEWNESDSHRSMKQVQDLLLQLILKNPSAESAERVASTILDTLVSTIAGNSTKPLVKSAIRMLAFLVNRSILALEDISTNYQKTRQLSVPAEGLSVWRELFKDLFNWMKLQNVSFTAGKLIMELQLALHQRPVDDDIHLSLPVWHRWLLDALSSDSGLIDPIKFYIFVPLFKADRPGALEYLQQMSELKSVIGSDPAQFGPPGALQLAALEVGKKCGIVQEPGMPNPSPDLHI
jgi:hypothetical protein